MEPSWFPFKGHEAILLFLRRSAMMNAISSDCEALSLGSQWVWYRELRSSNVTVRDPPMHSCHILSGHFQMHASWVAPFLFVNIKEGTHLSLV